MHKSVGKIGTSVFINIHEWWGTLINSSRIVERQLGYEYDFNEIAKVGFITFMWFAVTKTFLWYGMNVLEHIYVVYPHVPCDLIEFE
jgi:hypothetical protein